MKATTLIALSVLAISSAKAQENNSIADAYSIKSEKVAVLYEEASATNTSSTSQQTPIKSDESISESIARFYANSSGVSVLTITPEMFEMISVLNTDFKNDGLSDLLMSIKSMRVISASGNISRSMFYNVKLKIAKHLSYKEIVSISEGSKKTNVFTEQRGSKVLRWMILSISENDFTLVEIEGQTDMKTIGKALQSMNVNIEGVIPSNLKGKK